MIASDLAGELDIAPSVMSRRLKMYYRLTGIEKTAYLGEQTITDMRQVHALLQNRNARHTEQAIRIAIGQDQVAGLSAYEMRIESKIDQILEKVAYIEEKVLERSRKRQSNMVHERNSTEEVE